MIKTFLTVVENKTVHSLVLYGVAICARSFEFTTGEVLRPGSQTLLNICSRSHSQQ